MGAFNDADCVSAAIESIRAQTLADWELIVVNDGSTDGTAALLDRFTQTDRRVSVIHQEHAGLTQALIRGCAAARGEYIARQDADDASLPERLARQAAALDALPNVGLVSCWAQYVGPQGEPLEVVRRPTDPAEGTELLVNGRQGPPAHGTVMFRRSLYAAVGGYRPEFYFSQDNDLWLRMTEQMQVLYLGECLYRCRRCASGISGTQRAVQWEFGGLAFDCRTARDRGEPEAALLQRAAELTAGVRRRQTLGRADKQPGCEMSYIIGAQLAQNGDPRARKYLWDVLRRRPWHWRAWVRVLQSGWTARGSGNTATARS